MECIMVVLTVLMVVFTFLVWRTYKRLAWLTGAMESHSTWRLRFEAEKNGTNVIWWDKNLEPFPFTGAHGGKAETDTIYLAMPLQYRTRLPWYKRLVNYWRPDS